MVVYGPEAGFIHWMTFWPAEDVTPRWATGDGHVVQLVREKARRIKLPSCSPVVALVARTM